jgi:tripartite-type tricarboxylate transporter receptor subunit TctC
MVVKFPRRRLLGLAVGAAALAGHARATQAQAYPTRPIHFIVPFPPGSPNEILARLYGEKLNDEWHQATVVELRPGATGTIGAESVVRAPADGYTLLFTVDLPITMAPALVRVNYDPERDLIPIAIVARSENVLVAGAASGIRSMADLVAAGKARPGVLTFASAGHGSPSHLCGEMIERQAGIEMVHVPYTGVAPGLNAVLAGNVTLLCGPIGLALPFIQSGKVHALGVTGEKSSPLLPAVKPLSASYPGIVISAWFGLFAPAATPVPVVGLLHDAFKKAFADSALQRRLVSLGLDPEWLSGPDLRRTIADDIVKWRDFIATAHIKTQ